MQIRCLSGALALSQKMSRKLIKSLCHSWISNAYVFQLVAGRIETDPVGLEEDTEISAPNKKG